VGERRVGERRVGEGDTRVTGRHNARVRSLLIVFSVCACVCLCAR
jgi:hypothetical protein